jgi:hypothetical protein
MPEIPDMFPLRLGHTTYTVYRVPSYNASDLTPAIAPIWAFRPEGRNTGISYGLPVIRDETFAALKDRIAAYVGPKHET